MSTYFYILIFSFLIPFIFSFHPKIKFYKHWRAFSLSTIIIAPVFILWDIKFTKMGIWGFNDIHISGFEFFHLPIEEILFFIAIPYCCIFTHEVLKSRTKNILHLSSFQTLLISTILFISSMFFYNQLYTFSVLIGNSLLFLIIYLLKYDCSQIFKSFIILLIPFIIVNGLLTGSIIQQEVVWYNETQIWNIRLGTIPLEDTFYCLLLFVSQTITYQIIQKKRES